MHGKSNLLVQVHDSKMDFIEKKNVYMVIIVLFLLKLLTLKFCLSKNLKQENGIYTVNIFTMCILFGYVLGRCD